MGTLVDGTVFFVDIWNRLLSHTASHPGRRESSRSNTKTLYDDDGGVSEMTNWWSNRAAHDIAWCWRHYWMGAGCCAVMRVIELTFFVRCVSSG
jgi:hypothetical protein